MHVRNCGEHFFPALVSKTPTIDITTVRAVAVAASVLRVGTSHDHFYSDVDILIQVLLVGALPQIECTTIAFCPLAVNVESVPRQAGR